MSLTTSPTSRLASLRGLLGSSSHDQITAAPLTPPYLWQKEQMEDEDNPKDETHMVEVVCQKEVGSLGRPNQCRSNHCV